MEDEFTENEDQTTMHQPPRNETEPGEISSSDIDNSAEISNNHDRSRHRPRPLASKVVRVNKHKQSPEVSSQYDKFGHLRNDPDFKRFLDEMLDDRLSSKDKRKCDGLLPINVNDHD